MVSALLPAALDTLEAEWRWGNGVAGSPKASLPACLVLEPDYHCAFCRIANMQTCGTQARRAYPRCWACLVPGWLCRLRRFFGKDRYVGAGGRWSRVRSSGARIVNFAVQRGVRAHVALVQPSTGDVALWRRVESSNMRSLALLSPQSVLADVAMRTRDTVTRPREVTRKIPRLFPDMNVALILRAHYS